MIKEKPQKGTAFLFPYYAYASKNLTVSPLSEAYLTLTFSTGIVWANLMIATYIQQSSLYANIEPVNATTARIRVWNYSGDTSLTGAVRVMVLLPVNATISLS